jgi:NAD(P)-dependent dehydrogenase (short-subunit alcohol dehydrogenase family)
MNGMSGEMEGKVVLVTGASSGIGRATAIRFAAEGAHVALVARSATRLAEVEDEIAVGGGSALAIPTDVTREADIERAISATVEAYGGIDVLVNAAGIIATGNVKETTLESWDTMMNVNVRATFYLIQQALPFLEECQGNVVNVSSVTGLRAFPGILSYCASKAAVDQLTRCVALETASKGVRVNAINPGVIETMLHRSGGMADEAYSAFLEHSKTTHPLGRVGQPEEAADLIYFLASPKAGWITGATVSIDGGRAQTCAR